MQINLTPEAKAVLQKLAEKYPHCNHLELCELALLVFQRTVEAAAQECETACISRCHETDAKAIRNLTVDSVLEEK